ncbi:MAG TPA: hypothetical protein VJV78_11430 [Polyangiales bacterium]|nr:hypothetical protein [Polyangiales bacterium]
MLSRTLGLWLLLTAAACSSPNSPNVSGESHWLMACRDDDECGDGKLSCVCGTCTRACSTDDSCQGGQCYDTDSPLILQRCEARELQGAGVCLATCTGDGECGKGRACIEGACMTTAPFANVDAAVSWSEPVREPVPDEVIQGDASELLGTWREDCDPSMPANNSEGCMTITIERDSAGDVRGHIQYERTGSKYGPFAPAVDAGRGYPVEVTVSEYTAASWSATSVAYSLFNGYISADADTPRLEFFFDFSRLELWRTWCEMQTPYAWHIGERTFYYCVPQAEAEWSELDMGKVVLCRSAEMMASCEDRLGNHLPCACRDQTNPLCSSTVCSCTAQGCGMLAGSRRAVLNVSADRQKAALLFDESPILSSHTWPFSKVKP